MDKVVIAAHDLEAWADDLRGAGKTIVFTNGCFDLLHSGHVALLEGAGGMGDVLIVGINSDASVRRLKGEFRPVYPEAERAEMLSALRWVDYVTVFDEDTPMETIRKIRPDVLVKGAEYGAGSIVGEEFVVGYGGLVERFPMVPGYATSEIIRRIGGDA